MENINQLEKEKELSNIKLYYEPFEVQKEIELEFENKRFICLNSGLRTCKDTFCLYMSIKYFIECLKENREENTNIPKVRWWIIAPVNWELEIIWEEIKRLFPKELISDICDTKKYKSIETKYGGLIEMKNGYNADKLVGVGLDLVTIIDAHKVRELQKCLTNLEARLNSYDRGRLKDRLKLINSKMGYGKMIINGTNCKNNFFNEIMKWGENVKPNNRWKSFNIPWTANPVNKDLAQKIITTYDGEKITYEQDLIRRIGIKAYQQEYLAMGIE